MTGETEVTTNPPRVVGLDISLTATGIASSLGWCRLVGRSGVTGAPLLVRLAQVQELAESVLRHVGRPDLAVVEVPAFSRTGGGSLERSALWWTIVRRLVGSNIPVAEVYNNTRMRYATGKGSAAKTAIVDAVARRLPMFITGGNDNLTDAAILAAMGADHLGHPMAGFPNTHRAALSTVAWPTVPNFPTLEQ